MNQKRLNQLVVGLAVAFVVALLLFVPFIRDLFFSIGFGLFLVVGPMIYNFVVRSVLIPYVDSKSKSDPEKKKSNYEDERNREDFPVSIRVVFWLLMGAIVALIWIPLAPAILSLPLGLNRFALRLGWVSPSMSDGAVQYYWSWIFLAQYIGMFLFGTMTWGADFSYPKKES